jgi:hypothetical protein
MGRATTALPSPMCARPFANTSNAAFLRTALPAPAVVIADTTTLSPSPARAGESAHLQHPAHGGDGGTPDGSCVPAPSGAPVVVVCAEAAALLYARRWARAAKSSQIGQLNGIGRHNLFQTTMWTSTSIGEQGKRHIPWTAGGGYARSKPKRKCTQGARHWAICDSLKLNTPGDFGSPKPGAYLASCG